MIIDWIKKFRESKNKLILLDYDGTLTEYTPTPKEAIPSPLLLNLLKKLDSYSNTRVILVSGRKKESIDSFFKNLPIDIVAEHGALIKQNNKWNLLISADPQWKDSVIQSLNEFTKRYKGSFTEEKTFALAWHYRNVTEGSGYQYSRELIKKLREVAIDFNLKIIDGNKVVEVINNEIGKGHAVKYLLSTGNFDFVLCIGDDQTDEEMFEVLLHNKNAITIKVGEGNTLARNKLKDVEEVIILLKQIGA